MATATETTPAPAGKLVYYSFHATAYTPEGNRMRAYGHISGREIEGELSIPTETFERARKLVLGMAPNLVLKGDKPGCTTYPTLRRLKKKPKGF